MSKYEQRYLQKFNLALWALVFAHLILWTYFDIKPINGDGVFYFGFVAIATTFSWAW